MDDAVQKMKYRRKDETEDEGMRKEDMVGRYLTEIDWNTRLDREQKAEKLYVLSCKDQGWEFAHWFFQQLIFCERKSDSLMKKSKSLPPLFCHERPEQITHGCSFIMSNLRESLTVALL